MTPNHVFLRKEIFEYIRTWRIKLLLIPVAFFALTGPVLAYFTPEILGAALGSQSDAFTTLPDATWRDVYLQWVNNLQQIFPFLIVIIAAGSVAGEIASGTIIPVIAGGFSHARIVIIKFVVHAAASIIGITLGTIATWATGLLIFPDIPVSPMWQIIPLVVLLIILLVAITILASSIMKDTLGAAGVAIATFFLLAGLSIWRPAQEWTPAGLLTLIGDAATGSATNALWPAITTLLVSAVSIYLAIRLFERREI